MQPRIRYKKMSAGVARDLCKIGKISPLQMRLRDLLHGEISLPEYTAQDIRRMRQDLGLTQSGMAKILGVTDKTVLRWERGSEKISGAGRLVLCFLDRCHETFFEICDSKRTPMALVHLESKEPDIQQAATQEAQEPDLGSAGAPFDEANLDNRRENMPEVFDAQVLYHLRSRLGISRKDLADLMDLSESTIIKWESCGVQPKGPALILLKSLWLHGLDVLPE